MAEPQTETATSVVKVLNIPITKGKTTLAVNVDDFWASGAVGERLRFSYIAPTGYETFDAIPDRYVPRGTFIAMWREPRGFAQDLWSKWWGSQ